MKQKLISKDLFIKLFFLFFFTFSSLFSYSFENSNLTNWDELINQTSRTLVKIEIPYYNGQGILEATGFFISKNQIVLPLSNLLFSGSHNMKISTYNETSALIPPYDVFSNEDFELEFYENKASNSFFDTSLINATYEVIKVLAIKEESNVATLEVKINGEEINDTNYLEISDDLPLKGEDLILVCAPYRKINFAKVVLVSKTPLSSTYPQIITNILAPQGCYGSPLINKQGKVVGMLANSLVQKSHNTSSVSIRELLEDISISDGLSRSSVNKSILDFKTEFSDTIWGKFFMSSLSEGGFISRDLISIVGEIVAEAKEMGFDFIEALYLMGLTLFTLGELDDAFFYLKKVYDLLPESTNDISFLFVFASICYQVEEWELSDDLYKKAIKLEPENSTLHESYGSMLLARNYCMTAVKEYEKALEIKKTASSYYNLGFALTCTADYDLAEDAFQKSLEIERTEIAYTGLVLLFAKQKDFEKSDQYLREGKKYFPNSNELYQTNITKYQYELINTTQQMLLHEELYPELYR
ncbi:MAG: hypothetical protein ABIA04_00735 [Pseudomonadota bacterium]